MFKYMSDSEETENRTYEKMLQYAKECLLERSPQEIALKADVEFDEMKSAFRFESLAQKIIVDYPACQVTFAETGKPPYWLWNLIMLHYLDISDGTPLGSDLISFSELPGGFARGLGFDRDSAKTIAEVFGRKPVENIRKTCEALGAVFTKSNADICAIFPFLPCYPVMLKIWLADDELEGSGKMLINRQASHYLSMEDAVTAGSLLLDFLIHQYRLMFPENG